MGLWEDADHEVGSVQRQQELAARNVAYARERQQHQEQARREQLNRAGDVLVQDFLAAMQRAGNPGLVCEPQKKWFHRSAGHPFPGLKGERWTISTPDDTGVDHVVVCKNGAWEMVDMVPHSDTTDWAVFYPAAAYPDNYLEILARALVRVLRANNVSVPRSR